MKLTPEQKFILPDDDGNLILVTEIDFIYNALQNRVIPMKGIKFEVDYDANFITEGKQVDVQTSFTIDAIYTEDD